MSGQKRSIGSWMVAALLTAIVVGFTVYTWKPEVFRRQKEDKKEMADMPGMPGMKAEQPQNQDASSVFIPPERQQLIGIKTVEAVKKPLTKEIHTVGKVAVDETTITHIHTKTSGFVEEVFVDYVGKQVRRGTPLFSIYSPDLVASQEEYLLALKSKSTLQDSSFPWIANGSQNLLESTRRRLQLWDVTNDEIAELERTGKAKRALTVYSPVSGVVTERAAYHHGRYVTPDMDLYMIVDLSKVWLLGDVYESDLPEVAVGESVQVELPYAGEKRTRTGRVTFISPMLDPKTRTAQVRLEFQNTDQQLRPEMFVNFTIKKSLGPKLAVPEDAVLDTGTEQYVFVEKEQGYFEPRKVVAGSQARGFYAIDQGLKEGERVVTSANFILDSESRLKGAFANMGSPSAEKTAPSVASMPGMRVQIEEPKQAKTGRNAIVLSLKDASGNPVDEAQVEVTVSMPQMGSMPPMSAKASLKPAGTGKYSGEINIPMAWTWETTVTARKDGKMVGTAKTTITAR